MKSQYSATGVQITSMAMIFLLMLAYWSALPGPFLLDDFTNLPQAKVDSWSLAALIEASLSNNSGLLGRPVSALTFALNYLITGDSPFGFKAFNLAIHAASAYLVFLLFYKLTTEVWKRHSIAELTPCHLALAVAFLWALHPLHVSTVMYVVQRMSLLSTFFMLASMNCYASARLNTLESKKSIWGMMAASLLLGLLGIFSKENGILLIAFLVLIEWTIFSQSRHSIKLNGQTLRAIMVMGSAVTLMVAYPFISRFQRIMNGYEFREFSLKERLLTQPAVVLDYAGQTVFPRIDKMGLYFDAYPIVKEPDAMFIWPMLLLISLVVTFFLLLKRMPLLSLCIGIFLVSQLVESTFLPLELKFEHRNYFGSIGIIAGLVIVLGTCRFFLDRPALAKFFFGVLVLVLVSQTTLRSDIWKDELTFNSHEVERAPLSKRARSALAIFLSRAGRTDDALEQVRKIINQYPDDTYAPLQLFQMCALTSSNCNEEKNGALRSVIAGNITINTVSILGDLIANNRLGIAEGLSSEQLVELLTAALENPDLHLRNKYVARMNYYLSNALIDTKDHESAIIAIKNAIRLDSSNIEIQIRAAEILAGIGTIEEAEQALISLDAFASTDDFTSERVLAVKKYIERRRGI